MTLSKEAIEIRSEVQALRKGPGRKYTKALRERALSWIKRAVEDGMRMECDWQEALGIPLPRLIAWRDEERRIAATVVPRPVIPHGTETTALVPIALRDDDLPFGPMIAFSVPGGYRIEGLTLDQAIGLLRLFA
jgi:hypothetical protein